MHRIYNHLQYPWVKGYKKHPILYTSFKYLDLDPVLVRVLFLISLFLGGSGLLVYVILAIIMPGPDYSQYNYQSR